MHRSTVAVFDKQKAARLEGVDLSRKGSIDAPIQPLIKLINEHNNYFTTSSCSGRIIVVDNDDSTVVKKQGCKWILATHDKVTAEGLITQLGEVVGNAVFKFEPFVLHVQCRALSDAQELLSCGVASGFRNSGISVGNKGRFITAIRSTHSLEVPISCQGRLLVSTQYLEYLVDIANSKMDENFKKIDRFFENLKEVLSSEKPETCETKKKSKSEEHILASSKKKEESSMLGDGIVDDLLDCTLFDNEDVT